MMFTAGLAADILFYSCCEWILYANEPHIEEMGGIQEWASTYPLFHWGPIPLELLSGSGCSIRIYASCTQENQTEIF